MRVEFIIPFLLVSVSSPRLSSFSTKSEDDLRRCERTLSHDSGSGGSAAEKVAFHFTQVVRSNSWEVSSGFPSSRQISSDFVPQTSLSPGRTHRNRVVQKAELFRNANTGGAPRRRSICPDGFSFNALALDPRLVLKLRFHCLHRCPPQVAAPCVLLERTAEVSSCRSDPQSMHSDNE
jgi:hypothetical protein